MTFMKKIKSNDGFTLVELVIALAILAFIMTAVGTLMGSSVLSFRKSRADISVQNEAQAVYDKMSDVLMQSKKIVVHGYEVTFASADAAKNFLQDYKKVEDGKDGNITSYTECYYVATEEEKEALKSQGIDEGIIHYFESASPEKLIFVKEIQIDIALSIDVELFGEDEKDMMDALTGESVHVIKEQTSPLIYNINDTQRNTFTFDEKNVYYEKRHSLQTGLDDVISGDAKYNLYSDSLKHTLNDGTDMTSCIMTFDGTNGAVGLYIYFDDKSFSYLTEGMVKIRNSDVLKK